MTSFSLPIIPRYAEVDQQGVVFNAHYLTWFDEACTGFLDHLDVTYPGLIASGYDIQVVHSEIDFMGPVRWRDSVRVEVACERIGSTSFALGSTCCGARTVPRDERAIRGAGPQRLRGRLHGRLGQTADPAGTARSAHFR